MEKDRQVIILGGGTAGLITGLTLKKVCKDVCVTIVRSRDIGHIMVGEGTVGTTPHFLHDTLGISRQEFYKHVSPTWKLGVRFLWGKRPYFDYTFTSQFAQKVFPQTSVPLGYFCLGDSWDGVSTISAHMSNNTLPVYSESISADTIPKETAYHFENQKFVDFLENKFTENGGVLIDAKLEHVVCDSNGVKTLHLDTKKILTADLYVDASGFSGELIHKALDEPYISMRDSLFCDKAIVGGWERREGESIRPYTTAETMNAGWCWQIEHEHVVNRGYVHCSSYISEDHAIDEFKQKNPMVGDVRVVPFETRRIRRAWVKNVVAIGNSCGFVEPLEATNIQVICNQATHFAHSFNLDSANPALMDNYNELIEQEWNNIRDFLALHYRYNDRLNTDFWTMAINETPLGALQDYVDYYQKTGPNPYANRLLPKVDAFTDEGYIAMLLGMKVPWEGSEGCKEMPESQKKLLTLLKRGNMLKAMQGISSEQLLEKIRLSS